MSSQSATIAPAEEMGQVHIPVTVSSWGDAYRADAGDIAPGDVRSIDLGDVLADTGATYFCLAERQVRELGLRPVRDVYVETAAGVVPTRIYAGLLVTVAGRSNVVECIELPGGERPLLGAIPMEALGIELDLKRRTYWLRPNDSAQSYITA